MYKIIITLKKPIQSFNPAISVLDYILIYRKTKMFLEDVSNDYIQYNGEDFLIPSHNIAGVTCVLVENNSENNSQTEK